MFFALTPGFVFPEKVHPSPHGYRSYMRCSSEGANLGMYHDSHDHLKVGEFPQEKLTFVFESVLSKGRFVQPKDNSCFVPMGCSLQFIEMMFPHDLGNCDFVNVEGVRETLPTFCPRFGRFYFSAFPVVDYS